MGTHPIFESDFDCLTEKNSKMVKICVNSPEVAMHGEINIHAQVAIVTKAKLDAISVGGECHCGPAPRPVTPPKPVLTDVDIVFLVDGSDSFDGTKIQGAGAGQGGVKEGRTQFTEAMAWCGDFISSELGPNWVGKASATVVQFSGIKALESSYEPDNDGSAFADKSNPELMHYRVEHGPAAISADNVGDDVGKKLRDVDALDGNSQIFLALQDMSSEKFRERLEAVLPTSDNKRKRVLVTITDEEWDIKNLKASEGSVNKSVSDESDLDLSGGRVNRRGRTAITNMAHDVYDDMFAIIVRPNASMKHLNEEFVVQDLCKGNDKRYHKVYTDNFFKGMESAKKDIARTINNY